MAALLVKVLRSLNDETNRKNADLDKSFVKGLVIGFFTIKAVQNNEQMHKDLYIFMKGIAETHHVFVYSNF